MRSRFSADLPLAWYSVWYLLILMAYVFLTHLDRGVHGLLWDTDPNVFVFFRAVTEVGDSKWTLVPTGAVGLLLLFGGRYVFSGHRLVTMTKWLASALLFVFTSAALSGIIANEASSAWIPSRLTPAFIRFPQATPIPSWLWRSPYRS